MNKTMAIVLLALLVCSMSAFAFTLPTITKKDKASPLLSANLAHKIFADRFREISGPRVRIPPCVTQATPETFNTLVLESSKPVVVDFWAPWCHWCTVFKPTFDRACEEYRGRINFVGFNTDQDEGVWATYGLSGIPAQVMFNDGAEVARNSGAVSIELFRGWLNGVLRNLGL